MTVPLGSTRKLDDRPFLCLYKTVRKTVTEQSQNTERLHKKATKFSNDDFLYNRAHAHLWFRAENVPGVVDGADSSRTAAAGAAVHEDRPLLAAVVAPDVSQHLQYGGVVLGRAVVGPGRVLVLH